MNKSYFLIISYFKFFANQFGLNFYLIFVLNLLGGLFEGVGIFALLPLLNDSISDVEIIDSALVVFFDFINVIFDLDQRSVILVFIASVICLKGIVVYFAFLLTARLRGQLTRNIKMETLDAAAFTAIGFSARIPTGEFVNIIDTQTSKLLLGFQSFTFLGLHVFNTIVYVGIALYLSIDFGLAALVLGILLLSVFRTLNNIISGASRDMAAEAGRFNAEVVEALQGKAYLMATNRLRLVVEQIKARVHKLAKLETQFFEADAITRAVREPLAVFAMVVLMVWQMVAYQQTVESLIVIVIVLYRSVNAVLGIQGSLQGCLTYAGSIEAIQDAIERYGQNREEYIASARALTDGPPRIEFANVSYYYSDGRQLGFGVENVEFTLEPGGYYGIIGGSGSGKSTLLKLIAGLIKPNYGEILIDNEPLNKVIPRFRDRIGFVMQEGFLFSGSLESNIIMGAESDIFRLRNVIEQVGLTDFVAGLPDGLNSLIDERGLNLSGGQRQKVLIAREIYREPLVLIFDEATSAMDAVSEQVIRDVIEKVRCVMTVIQVSHRLNSLDGTDKIVFLDKGTVLAVDTFHNLKKNEDKFRYMLELQRAESSEREVDR